MLVVFLPPLCLFEMWWSDIEGKMTFIDYGHILLAYSDMGNQWTVTMELLTANHNLLIKNLEVLFKR